MVTPSFSGIGVWSEIGLDEDGIVVPVIDVVSEVRGQCDRQIGDADGHEMMLQRGCREVVAQISDIEVF